MPQDAFHLRRLSKELNSLLVGGKINRISQVNKDELTFIIYTGKETVKLILSTNASNARVCLSLVEKEPAPVAPNFCMLCRKHLQGAEILEIKQHEFERILLMRLHCTGDFSNCERVLVCELMGKYSNLILVENGVVLGALKTTALLDDTHRILFAGAKYAYPTPQDKLSYLDGAGLRSLFELFLQTHQETMDQESVALFLFENVSGLALPTAREIAKRYLLQNQPLWDFLPDFCDNQPCQPCLQERDGQYVDFFAFPVDGGIPTPSLCKAEDIFYTARETSKGFADKKRKLDSVTRTLKKKATKRLADLMDKLLDAEKAEENRQKGELLTANLYQMERGITYIDVDNWYDENGGKLRIALDSTLSPSKNAQRYFKLYNKQKRAKEILTPMKKAEEDEIFYVDSILSSIALAKDDLDLREIEEELIAVGLLKAPKQKMGVKKKQVEIPFRSYTKNGFTILVGRNNLQNDRLVKNSAPNDIWLHTQKYHSAHVVIVTDGRQVCDETLLYAAEICAYFSDGRNSGKIPVDYCKKKFVKKPNKSKAGFVIYTDYNTLLVQPKNPDDA